MKVTVITVCFNVVSTIEKTMQSVIMQNYFDMEYLIIDGASTDGTLTKIREYSSLYPIIKVVSEKDTGIYNAMNKGLRISTGEYINFLNAGDYYFDNSVISDVMQRLEARRTDVLYGGVTFYQNGRIQFVQNEAFGRLPYMAAGYMPCHQGIFARRSTFYPRGFDERFILGGDMNWLYQCHKRHYSIRHYRRMIAYHELGGLGNSNQIKYKKLAEKESEQALQENYPSLVRWRLLIKKIDALLK